MTNVTLKTTDGQTITTRSIGNGKTYKWALVKMGLKRATATEPTIHIANLGNNESAIMREKARLEASRYTVELVPVIDGIATLTTEQATRLAAA
jgi:hypothetical protein